MSDVKLVIDGFRKFNKFVYATVVSAEDDTVMLDKRTLDFCLDYCDHRKHNIVNAQEVLLQLHRGGTQFLVL